MIAGLSAALLLSGAVAAQDKKPTDPRARAFEAIVAGRKVSLAPGEAWSEFKPGAMGLPPEAAAWKLAGAWKSRKHDELTLRLFGVEGAGTTATAVRDTWFDLAKSKRTPGILVRTDVSNAKDKTLTGHDFECDFNDGDEKVYSWLRVLNIGKDKVAVLLAEARPLKRTEDDPGDPAMEIFVRDSHVQEIQPVFASCLASSTKPDDPWLRGPKFEISRGSLSVRVAAPRGWAYSRMGPEGGIKWTGPGDSTPRAFVEFASDSGFIQQFERDLVSKTGGRMVQDRAIESPAAGEEMITVMSGFGRTSWNWRRIFKMGDVWAVVQTGVFVRDVSASPAAEVEKEFKAFHDSVRFSK